MITAIYTGLNFTTKEINKNFKIKIYGVLDGKKINMAVGVRGLIQVVGNIDLTNRLLTRAFDSAKDKEECKLRRGIKITFYYQ